MRTPVNPSGNTPPVHIMHGKPTQPHDARVIIAPANIGRLLRLPVVEEKTGLKKSTIYAGAKDKTFPAPVRLSARCVAWREFEVDRWIAERVRVGA
jgi:prophage regulatory protein